MPKSDKLTLKQLKFVSEYLMTGNATQSAIKAGYSAHTARVIGLENLTKPAISQVIAAARAELVSKTKLTLERRVEMLSAAAEDCFRAHGKFTTILPDGEVVPSLTDENRNSHAIKRTKTQFQLHPGEGDGKNDAKLLEIETRDFLPYVQELNKMEGVYKPEGTSGGITVINDLVMPGDLDRRRRRKFKKKFDKSAQV